jgi:acetyltransferase
MKNGEKSLFRPILPEDEPQLQRFIAPLPSPDSRYAGCTCSGSFIFSKV